MWIILKNAEEVTEVYKKVAQLELEKINLWANVDSRTKTIAALDAKITCLELENETLQREVEHWKAEAGEAKRKVTLHRLK